jgi:hypothetical protein
MLHENESTIKEKYYSIAAMAHVCSSGAALIWDVRLNSFEFVKLPFADSNCECFCESSSPDHVFQTLFLFAPTNLRFPIAQLTRFGSGVHDDFQRGHHIIAADGATLGRSIHPGVS